MVHLWKRFIISEKHRLVWLFFVVLSLCLSHNILSYFFADYYNPSNYDITNNAYNEQVTDNYLRKVYKCGHYSWNEFPKERFAISRYLSHTNLGGEGWNLQCGSITVGKLISIYEGKGTDSYLAGFKNVKHLIWDYNNTKELFRTGKTKQEYCIIEEPYYKTYHYRNAISTYSISGLSSFFTNCEWWYKEQLNDIATQLNANHIPFTYIELDGKTAISYRKNIDTKCVLVYANGYAYLLETETTNNQSDLQSELLCSSVSLNHFQIVGGKRKMVTTFCLLFLCIFLTIFFFARKICKDKIYNRYAYSLFCVGIGSIFIGFIIAIYQSYLLFTTLFASCASVFILAGALITTTLISTPLSVFYYRKSREKLKYDYIVPSLLKRIHYDTITSGVKKKLYISFICYPLMVLSLLPLGIFVVLLYSIPLLLIFSLTIWFNKWRNWVKGSELSEEVSSDNIL